MYQDLFASKYLNIVYPRDKHKRALRGVKRSPDTFTDDDHSYTSGGSTYRGAHTHGVLGVRLRLKLGTAQYSWFSVANLTIKIPLKTATRPT